MSPKITKRYRCYRERGMVAFRTPYCDSSFSFYRKESLILIIIRYEKIQVPKDTFFVIILIWKTPSIFKLYSVNNVMLSCDVACFCVLSPQKIMGETFKRYFFLMPDVIWWRIFYMYRCCILSHKLISNII